jgi:hypothetical protein
MLPSSLGQALPDSSTVQTLVKDSNMAIPGERFQALIDIYDQTLDRLKILNGQANGLTTSFLNACNEGDLDEARMLWRTLCQYIQYATVIPTDELQIHTMEKAHFLHSGKRNARNREAMRYRRNRELFLHRVARELSGENFIDQDTTIPNPLPQVRVTIDKEVVIEPKTGARENRTKNVGDKAESLYAKLFPIDKDVFSFDEIEEVSKLDRSTLEHLIEHMINQGLLLDLNDKLYKLRRPSTNDPTAGPIPSTVNVVRNNAYRLYKKMREMSPKFGGYNGHDLQNISGIVDDALHAEVIQYMLDNKPNPWLIMVGENTADVPRDKEE